MNCGGERIICDKISVESSTAEHPNEIISAIWSEMILRNGQTTRTLIRSEPHAPSNLRDISSRANKNNVKIKLFRSLLVEQPTHVSQQAILSPRSLVLVSELTPVSKTEKHLNGK